MDQEVRTIFGVEEASELMKEGEYRLFQVLAVPARKIKSSVSPTMEEVEFVFVLVR